MATLSEGEPIMGVDHNGIEISAMAIAMAWSRRGSNTLSRLALATVQSHKSLYGLIGDADHQGEHTVQGRRGCIIKPADRGTAFVPAYRHDLLNHDL
jgi:hypothetical protein